MNTTTPSTTLRGHKAKPGSLKLLCTFHVCVSNCQEAMAAAAARKRSRGEHGHAVPSWFHGSATAAARSSGQGSRQGSTKAEWAVFNKAAKERKRSAAVKALLDDGDGP